jgi:hypothetical protein
MKKIFLFLLLASLGVAISFILATTEKISYSDGNYKSKKTWISEVLSYDKTKIFVINVTEKREMKKSINFSILYSETKYDTIETYNIQKEARIFLNDSNIIGITDGGVINLKDSIIPRWTHIFGKDIAVKRNIKISDNHLYLTSKNELVNPVNKFLTETILLILFVVLISNLICLLGKISSSWILLWIGIFISIILIFIRNNVSLIDTMFICSPFVLPTIIFIIIRIIRKRKNNRNFNKN